jgi:hypothetical protein
LISPPVGKRRLRHPLPPLGLEQAISPPHSRTRFLRGERLAPGVLEVPPAAPEIPVLALQIIPDLQREEELYGRFLVNTLG